MHFFSKWFKPKIELKAVSNPYHRTKYIRDLKRKCACGSELKASFCCGKAKIKYIDNVSAKRITAYLDWRTAISEEALRWMQMGMTKSDAIEKANETYEMPDLARIF